MSGERERFKLDCPKCGRHGQVVLEDGAIEHVTGFEQVGKLGLKCEECGTNVPYGPTAKAKPKAKAKKKT
jgi:endogenous inhibitor of DNA gyrase (YacG/DUF329 family)